MTASAETDNTQTAIQAWLTANSSATIITTVMCENRGTIIFIYT